MNKKPFFYRIDAARFLAVTTTFQSEKELGKFIKQFAVDLVTGNANSSYATEVITEAVEYINKKRLAGSKGGKQKASSAKASLKQRSSKPLASSSSSSSTEIKEEKKEYAEKVLMTEKQYQSLIEKHGEQKTALAIEKLSVAKCASKKLKYDSDYHAILKWVIDAVEKIAPTVQIPTPKLKYGDPGYVTDQRKLAL